MDKLVMTRNIEQVARQRNLMLVLLLCACISCLALSAVLFQREEKIILVPGLNQEAWISSSGVSVSYLEETAAMYLPLLLDLDAGSIDWKRERLFTHVSQSDERYMKELTKYFAKTKAKYEKFTLSTHFAVKSFEINQKNLTVKAFGQLSSHFGERGHQSLPVTYLLSFEWKAGKLLLREFVKLGKDEEEENDKTEN